MVDAIFHTSNVSGNKGIIVSVTRIMSIDRLLGCMSSNL